jgi:hypothetical protein
MTKLEYIAGIISTIPEARPVSRRNSQVTWRIGFGGRAKDGQRAWKAARLFLEYQCAHLTRRLSVGCKIDDIVTTGVDHDVVCLLTVTEASSASSAGEIAAYNRIVNDRHNRSGAQYRTGPRRGQQIATIGGSIGA